MPPTLQRELALAATGHAHVIGIDEAGRGPLAGPVVAAAVEFPCDLALPHQSELNDSKQLSAELREVLYGELTGIVPYGVGIVDVAIIDAINIRQASWLAMRNALEDLVRRRHAAGDSAYSVSYVLIDGTRFGEAPWPYDAIVKGDSTCVSIAAASVIAKVTRDRMMVEFDALYPHYGFSKHKGYASPRHKSSLRQHGPCPLHRRSFAPVREALELQLSLPADASKGAE